MAPWPISLFQMAADGQTMTPWQRSQYRFLQMLLAAAAAFLVTNAPLIQQLLTDPGSTDIWYNVRRELLIPFLMALFVAWQKYNSAQADVVPDPGTTTKAKASTKIRAQRAGRNDTKTPAILAGVPGVAATAEVAAAQPPAPAAASATDGLASA